MIIETKITSAETYNKNTVAKNGVPAKNLLIDFIFVIFPADRNITYN